MEEGRTVAVGGPYFEDLEAGRPSTRPALTLTWGHAAIHQAIAGDRLRLPLDAELSRAVTGADEALVHPNLVCDVAIGQSTVPTQRVLGNLFYRGLVLLRPVFRGDTLRTRTEVVALKQNRPRPDGTASGLAAAADPDREPARRAGPRLLPLPDDPPARPGRRHRARRRLRRDLPGARPGRRSAPRSRGLGLRRAARRARRAASRVEPGTVYAIEGRDTVTSAPELARLTLNLAMTHRDGGRRGARAPARLRGPDDLDRRRARGDGAARRWRRSSPGEAASTPRPSSRATCSATELTVVADIASPTGPAPRSPTCAPSSTPTEEARGPPEQVLDWAFLGVLA